ncbi:MAG: MFS transporter [Verrucomicrobiales bacterium]|jgi:acyl-[acyl-carrier-protein]-phospholipid O-acyltransferase/long-chain-fatty-acid--[acyl-carrier-protein] ligase|nr:MFS transporter [Verrucomicrobiales bacterium]
MNPDFRSLWRLLIAQAQGVFNDNAAKLALIGLAPLVLTATEAGWVTDLLAVLLVLPFVLFSPICGWLADRHPKRHVIRFALWLQVALTLLMTLALWQRLIWCAIALFFLLAVQTCLLSPAKQGALKEMVGSAHLTHAVSWLESLTITGILLGGLAGGGLFRWLDSLFNNPWRGAAACFLTLTAGCALTVMVFGNVKTAGAQSRDPFTLSLFWNHFRDLAYLWPLRELLLPALGIAYFYSLGGLLYLVIVSVGRELHPNSSEAVLVSGEYLAIMGGGIILGALLVIRLAKHWSAIRLVPLGGLGMTASLLALALLYPAGGLYISALLMLGVCSSLFIVPLNTHLQDHAAEDRRSRVIAAANLLLNIGGILAVAFHALLENIFRLHLRAQFLIMFAIMLTVSVAAWRIIARVTSGQHPRVA